MRPTVDQFEMMLQQGRAAFLRSTSGKLPHQPLNGEEVCELTHIANQIGLGGNYHTIRVIGEFCAITNPNGLRMFVDSRYADLYPPEPELAVVDVPLADAA